MRYLLPTLLMLPALAGAQQQQLISSDVGARWHRVHDRVNARVLARTPVRRPNASTIQRLVRSPENQQALAQGKALLQGIRGVYKAGGIKRGVRRGYTSTDVEYRGKNVANKMGLKKGQEVTWNTSRARVSITAQGTGRVIVASRPHDRYMDALRNSVNKIVTRLAKDPNYQPSTKEQHRLALAPTDLRAEAMSRAGFKLVREQRGKGLKYELTVKGEKGLEVFSKVFGPSISTYLPGKGHSQYLHNGWVVDFMFASRERLRATNRTIFPVMLSGKEARRMDKMQQAILDSFSMGVGTQGCTDYTRGRPPGYWPPRPGVDKKTGNTCTSTHHRAPVGKRLQQFRWLDSLDRSGLVQGSLLAEISKAVGQNRIARIDELMPAAKGQVRQQLQQLRKIVESYNSQQMSEFPLGLLGRKQLKDLMGVPFNAKRKGTTDPVGPGFARPMYSSAPERIPVIVRLKKD